MKKLLLCILCIILLYTNCLADWVGITDGARRTTLEPDGSIQ